MKRRTFLTAATTGLAAASLAHGATAAAAVPSAASADPGAVTSTNTSASFIDTNVTLSHWAVRRSWVETPATLVARLRRHGVTSAWTGSFDGVLHSDVAGVNARLAESCAREGGGVLRPFGTVNPTLPDWEDDVRRCDEVHRMAGVRLFPNYHGYGLDDARFARLLELAGQRHLVVQISLSIEDDRSQNPVLVAPPVVVAPLADVLPKFPQTRVMLLNSGSRVVGANNALLKRLNAAGVLLEIAALETVAGIENALKAAPDTRFTFGSHAPYFYFEAALLKLQESELTPAQLAAIRHGHAEATLART